ncbi:hypothetical protein [Gaetbulibacter aestuarii]|uniref:Lipoprotein n=1 Tax=Gaetbulibacter aestuarii TaxID=1502358 RepID=A0ABW7N1F7_9FLAO
MKRSGLIVMAFTLVSFISCKKKDDTEALPTDNAVAAEETIKVTPQESDIFFNKALKSIENGDRQMASKQIIKGVEALEKEGAKTRGQSKLNLDLAMDQLRDIAGKLSDNYDVSKIGYKEAVANSEINIGHSYLATDQVFVITPKDKANANKRLRNLDYELKNMAAGNAKLTGDAKKAGQAIQMEGEQLKKEYQDWEKRVDAHLKRTSEQVGKHKSEYNFQWDYPLW